MIHNETRNMTMHVPSSSILHAAAYKEKLSLLAKATSLSLDTSCQLRASNIARTVFENRFLELKVMEFLAQGRGYLSTDEDLTHIHAIARHVGLLPQNAMSNHAHPELRLLIAMLAGEIFNGDKLQAVDYENLKTAFALHYKKELAPYREELATIDHSFRDLKELDSDANESHEREHEQNMANDIPPEVSEPEIVVISPHVQAVDMPAPLPPLPKPFVPFSLVTRVVLGTLAALTSAAAIYYGFKYFTPQIPQDPFPVVPPAPPVPSRISNETVLPLIKNTTQTEVLQKLIAPTPQENPIFGQMTLYQAKSEVVTLPTKMNTRDIVVLPKQEKCTLNTSSNDPMVLFQEEDSSASNFTTVAAEAAKSAFYQNVGVIEALVTTAFIVISSLFLGYKPSSARSIRSVALPLNPVASSNSPDRSIIPVGVTGSPPLGGSNSKRKSMVAKRRSLAVKPEQTPHTPVHFEKTHVETVGSSKSKSLTPKKIADGVTPVHPNRLSSASYISPNRFEPLALLAASEMPGDVIIVRSPGEAAIQSWQGGSPGNTSLDDETFKTVFSCNVEAILDHCVSIGPKNTEINAFVRRMHSLKDERMRSFEVLRFAVDQYFDICEFKSYLPNPIESLLQTKKELLERLTEGSEKDFVMNLGRVLDKYESELKDGEANKYWFFYYTNQLLQDLSRCVGQKDFSVDDFIKAMINVVLCESEDEISNITTFLKSAKLKELETSPSLVAFEDVMLGLEFAALKLRKEKMALMKLVGEINRYTPTLVKDILIEKVDMFNKAYQLLMKCYSTYFNSKADFELAQVDKHSGEKPLKKTDPYLMFSQADPNVIETTLKDISNLNDVTKIVAEMNTVREDLAWEKSLGEILGKEEYAYLGEENLSFDSLLKAHKYNQHRHAKEAGWILELAEIKKEMRLKNVEGLSLALRSYNLDELRSVVEVSGKKEALMRSVTEKIDTYYHLGNLPNEFNEHLLEIISESYFDAVYTSSDSVNGIDLTLPKVISNVKTAVESAIKKFKAPFTRYPGPPFKLSPALETLLKPKSEVFKESAIACFREIYEEKSGKKTQLKETCLSQVDGLFDSVKGVISEVEKPGKVIHDAINLTNVNIIGFKETLATAVTAINGLKDKLEGALSEYTQGLCGIDNHEKNPFTTQYNELINGFITHLNNCNKPGSYGNLYNITHELTAFKEKLKKAIQSTFDNTIVSAIKNPRKNHIEEQFRAACEEQKDHVDHFLKGYISQNEQAKAAAYKECAKEVNKAIFSQYEKKQAEWTDFFQLDNAAILMNCIAELIFLKVTKQVADTALSSPAKKQGTQAKTPKPNPQLRFDHQLLNGIQNSAKKRKAHLDGFF